jgi:ABC-type uncharacterized transport system substrate-binding protein
MGVGILTGCGMGPRRAESATRLPRIGYLSANDSGDLAAEAFRQGLAEQNWIEGRNVLVEYRFADRMNDRLRDLAADLIRLPVDALVVGGAEVVRAAAETTQTTPIVFTFVGDPVAIGAAQSLARPGGNMTGLSSISAQLAELSGQHRMPTMFSVREYLVNGGLMAYGPNRLDMFRRAAAYVDKILKGARPSDLPVEQPTVFDFAINLKTAQALGIAIPQTVAQQATELIQ